MTTTTTAAATAIEQSTTLQALCRQEETHYRIRGRYLRSTGQTSSDLKVAQRRAKCRAAMVTWCCTVVDYLDFERDTVTIALNYLDRFLDTSAGKACLTTPRRFKIAGMSALYTAIKIHEPEAIEPSLVVELSGNLCQVEDIEEMERTILSALGWRVNPPTALAFCRDLLAVVPHGVVVSPEDCESLLDLAQVQTELAVSDPRLITVPPSLLALASIFNALESKHSSMETLDDLSQLFFVALAGSANLDMDAVFDVQDILDDIIRQHNNQNKKNKNKNTKPTQEEEDPTASPTTPSKEMAATARKVSNQEEKYNPLRVVVPVAPTPASQRPHYKAAEAA